MVWVVVEVVVVEEVEEVVVEEVVVEEVVVVVEVVMVMEEVVVEVVMVVSASEIHLPLLWKRQDSICWPQESVAPLTMATIASGQLMAA